ncbi:MAG: T9SS type A sorting domain-containing protein [Bacteroidetes bacterium]|nr:T9SS type A sorting domain-containing protein [Bacteroidota bacterium]
MQIPFNPTATIEYSVSRRSHVSLEVYDVLGRVVATLVDALKAPGNYRATFDGAGLPSGVYLYRLEAAGFTSVKKLILMK